MGTDLCWHFLYWDRDTPLDWAKGEEALNALRTDDPDWEDECGRSWEDIQSAFIRVKDAIESKGGHQELGGLSLAHLDAVFTGGMSWGESPTELFDDISTLEDHNLLEPIGFFTGDINYKELLRKVLDRADLPLLLGIDEKLDAMISERLKKG